MRVALVHDWLTGLRGGERCLQAFLKLYPDADIFTLLHVAGTTTAEIDARVVKTSFIQKLPWARKLYRYFLPLYPLAIRRFNFEGYDLVISLSHAAAKNVHVPKNTLHITYCFTPMRYIWDQTRSYFGSLTVLLWPLIALLRRWDRAGGKRVDALVGISNFIGARIRCFYKRRAEIIYPPVDTSWIVPLKEYRRGVAFLYAGALVPYKRVDLVIEAFNRLGHELWIVGTGPEERKLKAMAKSNISFFGHVPDGELASFYRRARALIFPAREDFGIIPIECMAAGRPVIGLYDGALRESVTGLKSWEIETLVSADATGVFFQKRSANEVTALCQAVEFFIVHENQFLPRACTKQAAKFNPQRFEASWKLLLERLGVIELKEAKQA